MKKYKYILLGFILISLFSCNKNADIDFVGTWRCEFVYENETLKTDYNRPYMIFYSNGTGFAINSTEYLRNDSINWNYNRLTNRLNIDYINFNKFDCKVKVTKLDYDNLWYKLDDSLNTEYLFKRF